METHLILRKYLIRKKQAARGFSMRGLAQELDLSPSFLSRVMNGSKPVPYRLLLKLGKALDIEPEVFAGLKRSHQLDFEESAVPRRGKVQTETLLEEWELAPEDSQRILRNWFYLAILDMTSLGNFDGSAAMISRRLGISKETAEIAVRDLLSLGLLKNKDGRLVKAVRRIRWASSTSLEEIRRFHSQMLEKAQNELKTATTPDDFSKRLITGITLTASAHKIEAAKKKLAECLHEIANDLMKDEGTEVYHLATQFFPLTKGK